MFFSLLLLLSALLGDEGRAADPDLRLLEAALGEQLLRLLQLLACGGLLLRAFGQAIRVRARPITEFRSSSAISHR